jgi:DNA-binding MarR family transcriptional regulator
MSMDTLSESNIPYRALASFRYEIRRYLNFSERAARSMGVEPRQHQALLAIKGLPLGQDATVGFLAERLQIRHHSAVELTIRLERKKLIHRSRNVADRRQVLLSLTRPGERLLRKLSQSHRAELSSAGPKLLRALELVVLLAGDFKRSCETLKSRGGQSKRASKRR